MHPLDGCRAKIQRARLHIAELGESVRAFADHAPYKITGEHDQATNEFVFRAEAVPDFAPVPIDLILIAGEVAHQLRSALDHLVWQLVIANTGLPPPRPATRIQFPIFKTEAGYNERAPSMIVGVSDNARMRIQAAQPYHAGPDAERTLTWVVQQLNNTEKHRIIPVTTSYSFVGRVRMFVGDSAPVDILPWQEEVREALHDGMEIARVPIVEGMDDARFDIPVGFDVAFEQVGAVVGQPATSLLIEATDYMSGLIESFRGEFR
jgi:hypothetical protein